MKTVVDLPGPLLRGMKQGDRLFVSLEDLLDHIEATAAAFDAAHANDDISRSFRAFGDAIKDSKVAVLEDRP